MSPHHPPRRVSLPVVGQPGGIRRSRAGRWRAGVLILVHVLILAHIAHWLAAGETLTPVEPSEAIELARRGVVNAGLIFFALAALSTAVFGRFVCGWGCHLVALQDLCQWLLRRVGIRPRPLRSRLLAWVPALAFAYMFLWPAAYRGIVGAQLLPLRTDFVTPDFWATMPGWTVGIATLLVCGFGTVYLLGAKGFCTYACPYGALFGLADRVAPGRIRVSDDCDHCGHCTAVCTSNVRVHEEVRDYGMVVDPGCMKCLDCVSVCPKHALSFSFGVPSLLARSRAEARPVPARSWKWSEELVLALSFAFAFFSVRGLYEAFPFLFSLGIAGCFSFLTLVGWRLLGEGNVAVRRLQLARAGRLQRAGLGYLALYVPVALFLSHSAVVQYEAHMGTWLASRLGPVLYLEPAPGARLELAPEDGARVDRAYRHLERARRWGVAPQPRLALPLARLAFLSGRSGELATRASEAAPASDAALAWRLVALDASARAEQAIAESAYRRALELAPQEERAYLELGALLSLSGRHAAAAEVFDQGRGRLPNSAALPYNAALNRALEGRTGEAVALCREALQRDATLRPAVDLLAELEAQQAR